MAEELPRIAGTIAAVKDVVSRQFRAEIVGVFGSYARGQQTSSSDLDVLVNFQPGATLFDLVGLADFLEERLSVRVDIVPVDTLREEIREQVLKETLRL
jgi:predicted nucleotidyltransferase